ncbi:MAG: hypothetical protein PUK16_02610 [Prevotellaceae bacterium]|nr:hypothetical protein [Prevotellaceae bacterium]
MERKLLGCKGFFVALDDTPFQLSDHKTKIRFRRHDTGKNMQTAGYKKTKNQPFQPIESNKSGKKCDKAPNM